MPPIPVMSPLAKGQIYPPAVVDQVNTALAALNAQTGSVALVAGTVTVSGVTLTSTSVITLSRTTQGGTITSTVGYEAPGASRNTGARSFVINAVTSAGAVATGDTSTIDWSITG